MKQLKKITAILCSTLFGVLFAEIALRAAISLGAIDYPNPDFEKIIHRYSENIDLIYELKASAETSYKGSRIRTNSWGMRDREYSLEKPEDVFRIAVLGDSVSFGHHIASDSDVWTEILEQYLNQDRQAKFEVLNFSVVGYNSAQEQIVLEQKVHRFSPDLVILGFCQNDDTYTDGLAELARQTAPWSLGTRLHSRLVSYLMHKYERIYFKGWRNRQQIDNLFAALASSGAKRNFKVAIVVFPTLFESVEKYKSKQMHSHLRELSDKHSFALVDFMDLWAELDFVQRKELYLPRDKIHFSKTGMREIALTLAEQPLISNRGPD